MPPIRIPYTHLGKIKNSLRYIDLFVSPGKDIKALLDHIEYLQVELENCEQGKSDLSWELESKPSSVW